MLGSSVEMFLTEIPYVSKKSISLFGVLVVEFGRLPNSWMNGLSIPLCNLNHSIEKGITPFLVMTFCQSLVGIDHQYYRMLLRL